MQVMEETDNLLDEKELKLKLQLLQENKKMPGQPSPTNSTSSLDATSHDDFIDEFEVSSVDSEMCDDPTETLVVPFATVGVENVVNSNSPSPPPIDETDSGILPDSDPFDESSSGSSVPTDDELGEKWDPSLYTLQCQTPKPKCVYSDKTFDNCPPQYGKEFHGVLELQDVADILGDECGSYLVRETPKGAMILSFMLSNRMYNYRLYYEEEMHFVGDNKFDNLQDLVEDGLITLYLQNHDVAKTMEEGRTCTLARKKTQKKLKRQHGRRVKGLKGRAAWLRSTSSGSVTSMNSTTELVPARSPSPSPTSTPILPLRILQESDLDQQGSSSAPQTPMPTTTILTPNSDNEQSDLDFSPKNLRRSTPNLILPEEHVHLRTGVVGQRSPLAARRVRSASSIGLKKAVDKEKRYSAIFSTLRDAVNVDRTERSRSMDNTRAHQLEAKARKATTLGPSRGRKSADEAHSIRHSMCNISDKLHEHSQTLRGFVSSAMSAKLLKHTTGPQSPYYKAHNFQLHTYKGPTWCEICHHFLWGLKYQGMRCKDCGMDIHKQCVPIGMQMECYPNKQFVKRVFGADLTTRVKLEGNVVPNILSVCLREIQSRGLSLHGIYRISGQSSEILDLKEKFDAGEDVDLSQYTDVNIITGVVKLYLRELPIPLITFDAYSEIRRITANITDPDDADLDWKPLGNALKLLPRVHYITLQHLAQHLHKIDSHSDENKMSARNLAVVFAPTLMRAPSDENTLVKDLHIQKNFVEYVILKHDILFR